MFNDYVCGYPVFGQINHKLERMKNIQVIDGADNSVYDIFQATDEEFHLSIRLEKTLPLLTKFMSEGRVKNWGPHSSAFGNAEFQSERQWVFMASCTSSLT